MTDEKTILSLNDDCLLLIASLLYKREQKQLKRVCQRFSQIVNALWSVKYKRWIRTCDDYERHKFSFVAFHLREFVEVLQLGTLLEHEANLILGLVFPKTRSLTINLERITESESLNILMNVFPNLTALSVEAHIDLDSIAKLQNITELHVEYQAYEGTLRFKTIFTTLKLRKISFAYCDRSEVKYDISDFETILLCKTLEVIRLNAIFLDCLVTKLPQLPKLRVISCYAYSCGDTIERNIFEKTVDVFGTRIRELMSHNIFFNFPMGRLQDMPNLRKWTMRDMRVGTYERSELSLKNLRELQIFGQKVLEASKYEQEVLYIGCKDFEPLDLVAACENLEILGIPRDWVNNVIKLDDLCAVLRSQKHRNTRLHLKCYDYRMEHNVPFVHPDAITNFAHEYNEMLYFTNAAYSDGDEYKIFRNAYKIFEINVDMQ